MSRSYAEYVARAQRKYGERFSDAELARKFVPFFESGARIKVRLRWGEEMTGTIGATTGWRPCFLLMRRSDSIGSPWTLSEADEIIAVQRNGRYVAL